MQFILARVSSFVENKPVVDGQIELRWRDDDRSVTLDLNQARCVFKRDRCWCVCVLDNLFKRVGINDRRQRWQLGRFDAGDGCCRQDDRGSNGCFVVPRATKRFGS